MKQYGKGIIGIVASFFLLIVLSSCSQQQNKNTVKVGNLAPDFSITDLDGKVFSLSEYKGSPVILRFFLTDCKFCRADTPVFNEYHIRFSANGLRILYVDVLGLDPQTLLTFKKELSIPFPVASDSTGEIAASYKVKSLPVTVVLDPQHTIIAAILGGVSGPELETLLSPYLPFDN